jgi:hypothetical protein
MRVSARLLILFASIASAATVYEVARRRGEGTVVYSAVARVLHPRQARATENGGPGGPSRWADADAIQREIACDENLRQILGELAGVEPKTVSDGRLAETRHSLRVELQEPSKAGPVEVSFSFRDGDADRAAGVADRLAAKYAEACRREMALPARRKHELARHHAEEARAGARLTRQQLVQFLDEHFVKHAALAEGRTDETARWAPRLPSLPVVLPGDFSPGPAGVRVASDEAPLVDNPEWLDLNAQLGRLLGQRERLLVHLMPAHPQVRQLDAQIKRVEALLAEVPRRIPDRRKPAVISPSSEMPAIEAPDPGSSQDPSTIPAQPTAEPPGFSSEEHVQAARRYEQLAAAAERAEEDYLRWAEQERSAWQAMLSPPPVTLRLSSPAVSSAPAMSGAAMLVAALLAGLAMAIGLGMILMAGSHRETFASVEEAEAELPVPVVGTIPASGASSHPDEHGRSPLAGMLAAGGMMLMVLCAGVVLLVLNR